MFWNYGNGVHKFLLSWRWKLIYYFLSSSGKISISWGSNEDTMKKLQLCRSEQALRYRWSVYRVNLSAMPPLFCFLRCLWHHLSTRALQAAYTLAECAKTKSASLWGAPWLSRSRERERECWDRRAIRQRTGNQLDRNNTWRWSSGVDDGVY